MEFLKIWEILSRRKWIFISVFSAFFSIVVLVTLLITPTYKAKAKLIIEASDTISSLLSSLGTRGVKVGGMIPIRSTDDEYKTDIALAKIKPLMEKLISSLNLKDRHGKAVKPDKLADSGLMSKLKYKVLPQPYLEVAQYKDADMLEIISYSPRPSEAVNMSNKLATLYIEDRLERTRKGYKSAKIFIKDQIQKVKEEYYESLSALSDFKISKKTVNLDTETQNLINKIATLKGAYEDSEKTIIESRRKMAESRRKLKVMEKFRKNAKEFNRSDILKSLQIKLSDYLMDITKKSVEYTKEHPDFKILEKEVETAKELIKKEKRVALSSISMSIDPIYDELSKNVVEACIDKNVGIAKKRLLQKYINTYQDELLNMPLKQVENSKLELALSVNKDRYQNLLEYMMYVSIAESMTLSNIRLVEAAAAPDKPHFPKKSLNFIVGTFLSMFWGLVLSLFIEYIDNTIKTPDDIKHIKSLNFLGAIPRAKTLKDLNIISNLSPTLPVVEAYRTIRSSILYAFVDKPIKTFVVTSLIESEGKSSVASNISITYSKEHKRVILIDLDLRRPSAHKFFKIHNENGITSILAEGLPLEDAIAHTTVLGLDVLPSGPIPPDPSSLIESQKLKDIIHKLKEMYDMVVIDSPPVLAVNDAVVIGRIADGVLLVIESGRSTFSMVEHVKELFTKASLNTIGIVLNKFKAHEAGYYHYYYNRSY